MMMAAVVGPTAAFSASMSPNGRCTKPGRRAEAVQVAGLPEALTAAYVRPWNEPSKPMMSMRSDWPLAQ
jgi:hypothetical protein